LVTDISTVAYLKSSAKNNKFLKSRTNTKENTTQNILERDGT